jgi:hypothetical protein
MSKPEQETTTKPSSVKSAKARPPRKRKSPKVKLKAEGHRIVNGVYVTDGTTCSVSVMSSGHSDPVCCGHQAWQNECEFHYYLRVDREARSECRSHKLGCIIDEKTIEYATLMHRLVRVAIQQYNIKIAETSNSHR